MIEPLYRASKCAFRSEGTNVQLINDGARERFGLPIVIGPGKGGMIDQTRRAMQAIRLELRPGVGNRTTIVDYKRVLGAWPGILQSGFPPAVVHWLQRN